MRTYKKFLWALGTLLLAAFTFGVTATANAQEEEPEPIPDHLEITEYTGPETCTECHLKSGQEVAESLHYQNHGPAPYLVGAEEGQTYGMLNTY